MRKSVYTNMSPVRIQRHPSYNFNLNKIYNFNQKEGYSLENRRLFLKNESENVSDSPKAEDFNNVDEKINGEQEEKNSNAEEKNSKPEENNSKAEEKNKRGRPKGSTKKGAKTAKSENKYDSKKEKKPSEKETNASNTTIGTGKKEKKPLTAKGRSAKKTRLKNKLAGIIPIIEEITSKGCPSYIVNSIKKAKLELVDLDVNQQRTILSYTSAMNKLELAIMLLLIPKTAEELSFLKNVFLTRQFIDLIFKNINSAFIE